MNPITSHEAVVIPMMEDCEYCDGTGMRKYNAPRLH
jgi:hypothetical protein